MKQFTVDYAKELLLTGEYEKLKALKPFGVSVEDCLKAALDIAHTNELDTISLSFFGVGRRAAFYMPDGQAVPEESDADFRDRLKRYAVSSSNFSNTQKLMDALNTHSHIGNLGAASAPPLAIPALCRHKWETYVGLNQTFDYCITCDQKRNQ